VRRLRYRVRAYCVALRRAAAAHRRRRNATRYEPVKTAATTAMRHIAAYATRATLPGQDWVLLFQQRAFLGRDGDTWDILRFHRACLLLRLRLSLLAPRLVLPPAITLTPACYAGRGLRDGRGDRHLLFIHLPPSPFGLGYSRERDIICCGSACLPSACGPLLGFSGYAACYCKLHGPHTHSLLITAFWQCS